MNKWVKPVVIIIFVISFFMVVVGGFFNLLILWSGFTIIMAEIIGVLIWQIQKLDWHCDKCRTIFSITWKQNLLGINGGSVKELYCPHCQKKTWCSPVIKKELNKKL